MPARKPTPDRCVPFLKALADEPRRDTVRALIGKSLNVSERAEQLDLPQPHVSKHIRLPREAGIVVTVRAGKEARRAIAPAFRAEVSRTRSRLDPGCRSFDSGAART